MLYSKVVGFNRRLDELAMVLDPELGFVWSGDFDIAT